MYAMGLLNKVLHFMAGGKILDFEILWDGGGYFFRVSYLNREKLNPYRITSLFVCQSATILFLISVGCLQSVRRLFQSFEKLTCQYLVYLPAIFVQTSNIVIVIQPVIRNFI